MTRITGSASSAAHRIARALVAVVLSLLCLYGIWFAGRIGFSRLLTEYSAASSELATADAAVRLTPNDSRARTIRGLLLSQSGDYANAAIELEQAAALRPRDYFLWLELGIARDQIGDLEGAIGAFRESIRLAPYYARPRWQLGNLLFRAGRHEEALVELAYAAKSNSLFLPHVIELAWAALRNPEGVRSVLQPQTVFEHMELAKFLARQGQGKEAVAEFRAAGDVPDEYTRELIVGLLAQKDFAHAREVWAKDHAPRNESGALVYDGGFEGVLEVNDPGFGWQVKQNIPALSLSLDAANPYQEAKSLRIDFRGESNPAAPVVSQIILVDPRTHYRLRLATRTQELVSGGLPYAVVSDATTPAVPLAQSEPFGSNATPWHESLLEFTTGAETSAVLVYVRRAYCTTELCPIFGSLWLDAFSLRKM